MAKKKDGKKNGEERSAMKSVAVVRVPVNLFERKLLRVLKSSGLVAAQKYANKHSLAGALNKLTSSEVQKRREDAKSKRMFVRQSKSWARHQAALTRHAQARAAEKAKKDAEAAAKKETADNAAIEAADKKAKRSAAAVKGAATRKARKEALKNEVAEVIEGLRDQARENGVL